MSPVSLLDLLDPITQLAIYKEVDIKEKISCREELREKYKISKFPSDTKNGRLTDEEFKNLPSLFEAKEKAAECCPNGWHIHPPSEISIFPPNTPEVPRLPNVTPVLTMRRPSNECVLDKAMELNIVAELDQVIGKVVAENRYYEEYCECTFWSKNYDANGRHVYSIKAKVTGNNCCAPSCCNPVFRIQVMDPIHEKTVLSDVLKVFPGLNKRGLCIPSASNYIINFPEEATKEQKALILGSVFLNDYRLFYSAEFV